MSPTIYIVIAIHNRLAATRECLDSLWAQTYRQFDVIVVDDGSTDGSSDFISSHYPEVRIVRGNGELWWTGATNAGIKCALKLARTHDCILTLNNDTVLPNNYLETLVRLSMQAPDALIGSVSYDYDRKSVPVDQGVTINWFSAKFTKLVASGDVGAGGFYPVAVLPGRGTLIPVRVIQKIGLFDERNFPHYAADYDYSLRAMKAGHALLLHPDCYLFSKTRLTGISNTYNKLSFCEWIRSFGSKKSANNLMIRLRFALRHAPVLCIPSYIVCDFLRVTVGTFRKQIRNLVLI